MSGDREDVELSRGLGGGVRPPREAQGRGRDRGGACRARGLWQGQLFPPWLEPMVA